MSDKQIQRDTLALLHQVTSALPQVEERQGQNEMAAAIAIAVEKNRHLIVQAGTGTGKTLGYLVPLIASGKRIVVSTYTKALQDQLAANDLPLLTEVLGKALNRHISWAVLKGRSNYICAQRVDEVCAPKQAKLDLESVPVKITKEVQRLTDWASETDTGDQGDLTWSPSDQAWRMVSVGSDECPGATRCPAGSRCFTERARDKAAVADVIVVNTHIYGLHIATGGALLPEHEVVVFDEAHQLEDVISASVSTEIGPGRVNAVASSMRSIIRDDAMSGSLNQIANDLHALLSPHVDKRLPTPLPDDIQNELIKLRLKVDSALETLRTISSKDESVKQRALRAQTLSTRLIESIDICLMALNGRVAFVSGSRDRPVLEIAPLDVGPSLIENVWNQRTAILTSATIPLSLPNRIGLEESSVDVIDVGSPFDYEQSLLYCAKHLPEPNSPLRDNALHDEIERLISAAGGRTLALFTTYRALNLAADEMSQRLPFTILRQDDLPKMALINAFSQEESSCLFATAGFFQGVDVPGRTLSLVIIDKIPFPRPDDPLLSARRDVIGRHFFSEIDIPIAATQLSQASGRLIRTQTDRGVVAILDPRLATKGYGKTIVATLPPMPRTVDREEAESFLRSLT
ncbi:MAG: ATP-dependent DNA helicase [Actinobacteria bacterium]|nr:MAG: ATP-dependent DNA helicase [Actinomycetota bacterium]